MVTRIQIPFAVNHHHEWTLPDLIPAPLRCCEPLDVSALSGLSPHPGLVNSLGPVSKRGSDVATMLQKAKLGRCGPLTSEWKNWPGFFFICWYFFVPCVPCCFSSVCTPFCLNIKNIFLIQRLCAETWDQTAIEYPRRHLLGDFCTPELTLCGALRG